MASKAARQAASQAAESSETDAPVDDEKEQLRRELAAARAEAESHKSYAQQERSARLKAEEATMSETERRLRSELSNSEALLSSLDSEADQVENRIAELADEPGHGKDIAKLNRRLAEIAADRRAEADRKNYLAGQAEKAKGDATKRSEAQTGDVLATGVPLMQFTPAVQKWFRDHPKSFSDRAYVEKAVAAANYAQNVEGFAAESEDWFAFIDSKLEAPAHRAAPVRQTETDDGEDLGTVERPAVEYAVEKPQTRAAGAGSLALTPSRQVPGNGGNANRRTPMLTSQQREAADALYGHIKNPADRYTRYFDNLNRPDIQARLGRNAMAMN